MLPVLIYYVVTEKTSISFSLFLYISLLLEGYFFLPLGFYFCTYFSVWIILSLTKDYISWQSTLSLFFVILVAQLWFSLMKLMLFLSKGLLGFILAYDVLFSFALSLIFSFIFFLCILYRNLLDARNMR